MITTQNEIIATADETLYVLVFLLRNEAIHHGLKKDEILSYVIGEVDCIMVLS